MARGRKPSSMTGVKRKSTARRSKKIGTAKGKLRLRRVMKKGASLKKKLGAQLKAKAAEMKSRLKAAESNAMKKALGMMKKEMAKKESERRKAVAAAEAKFEKAYAKKTARTFKVAGVKKAVRRGKRKVARAGRKATMVRSAKKRSSGRRGRPSKAKAAIAHHTSEMGA